MACTFSLVVPRNVARIASRTDLGLACRFVALGSAKEHGRSRSAGLAGQLALPLLRGFQKESVTVTAACVRALGLIGGDEAVEILAAYANDARVTIWNELVPTWSGPHFDPIQFSSRVLSNGIIPNHEFTTDSATPIPGLRHLPHLRSLTIAPPIPRQIWRRWRDGVHLRSWKFQWQPIDQSITRWNFSIPQGTRHLQLPGDQ